MRVTMAGVFLVMTASVIVADEPPTEYEFVPSTNRRVGLDRSEYILVGKLDADGEFISISRLTYSRDDTGVGILVTSGPAFEIVNRERKSQKVYEYRSGLLVPGVMEPNGKFVPEEGGVIEKFSAYKYSPAARRIWNLPGAFRPKGQTKGGERAP